MKLNKTFSRKPALASSKVRFLIFIAVFGAIGGLVIFFSSAAISSNYIEPETNALSGNASTVADANASNGSYVLFEACPAGQTGTPPNCVTPPLTPTVTISASPTSITSGSSSTITWSSTNASSCTASGSWSGTKATSGSQSTGNLTTSQTYTLTCSGAGGSENDSVGVTVTGGVVACNLNATTANFSSQLTAATAGQTVCLATGNYGTWNGINKAITIATQANATPTIELNIGLGDGNFTIDGLTISGGIIYGNQSNYGSNDRPQNITIKNSTFTGTIDISYIANANILLDHNTHNNIDTNSNCTSAPARVWVSGEGTAPSGVTLSNSVLSGGNTDGVQVGLPMSIFNNEFYNIQEKSSNDCAHTDAIQFYGGTNTIISGNYIHDSADGIVAYDGTSGNVIENNVIELVSGRFGIELYSDKNSIVRHNTLVYGTGCAYAPCGGIYLDHKSVDPAGSGTVIENNIATSINFNGSTASVNRNNMLRSGASGSNFSGVPIFSGGGTPNTFIGFMLASGSPGINAGSDGKNVGIN